MVRCGCASDQCSCTIIAGDGAEVTGTGTKTNPYVLTAVAGSAGSGDGTGRFSGEISLYAGNVPPPGWLVCNGAALNRNVYAGLFAAIGVQYGAGDGSTTFNLPDITSRFPVGVSGSFPRGGKGGKTTLTLTTANMPEHSHTIASSGSHSHVLDLATTTGSTGANLPTGGLVRDRGSSAAVAADGAHTHTAGSTGGGSPVDVMPPYIAVNYIIKT